MNLRQERIAMLYNVLKLDRMGSEWPAIAQWAAAQDNSHGDFLEKILNVENDARLAPGSVASSRLESAWQSLTSARHDYLR
ncbi:MAG: hypothetical protein NTAFB09_12810 [Nitrosospira sp.]